MRRRLAVTVLSIMLVPVIAAPTNGDVDPSVGPDVATASVVLMIPHVVSKRVIRPHRWIVKRLRFTPWVHPGPRQVREVLDIEAARWGISAAGLEHRAFCESGFRYWATNGQYEGIGQFASETFYRGMASIGTRKVVLRDGRTRLKRSRVVRTMSDGRQVIGRGRLVRQHIVRIKTGMIPASPIRTHVWAQARIMARAVAGLGAVHSSEWECGM